MAKKATVVTLLLKQHVGAPCMPVVKKGDKVHMGDLVAKSNGLGANIHSSITGVVKDIKDNCIIIEGDTKDTKWTPLKEQNDLLECIKEAGIVGMGGAGFPTGVKLSTKVPNGYILVNAAECEPLLSHNMVQIMEEPEKTIRGIEYAMKMTDAKYGVIAIKQKHEKEINKLKPVLKDRKDIRIHLLADIYPMGEERAVIRECLGILLGPADLPSKANAQVVNVETVLRIAEAIEDKKPSIVKNLTVVGKLKKGTNPQVFLNVPVGTTVGELIEKAGGISGKYGEIIMGGPFTGQATTLDTPITKTTGGIIVTEPFEDLKGAPMGLLVCACGGNENRMKDMAKKMNAKVVLIQSCKQAVDPKGNGALKCENPGNCPGQAQKCMNFKKAGCTDILIGNCSDCTNTVMGSGPKMGLGIHHQTDHVLKTVGMEVMRHLTKSKFVDGQLIVPDEIAKEEGRPISNSPYNHIENNNELGSGEIAKDGTEFNLTYKIGNETFKVHVDKGVDVFIKGTS